MELVSRIDDFGKPAWIVLMILGFIVFWPIGLALLFYLIWSGRMGCGKHGGRGRWHFEDKARDFADRKLSRFRMTPSGNTAFDEYREETLRRLEREHDEFKEFLRQLRHARDKAEFDQFMAERRNRTESGEGKGEGPELPEDAAPQPQA
jgi:hypothetical protein